MRLALLTRVAILGAALLAGCAAAPPAPPEPLLADRLFAPPREAIRTDDIFALSDAAKRAWLQSHRQH